MPEKLEHDIERYVEALSARVASSTPVEAPERTPAPRQGRLLMAAALVVLVAGVVAALAWPRDDTGDGPVATDPTTTETTEPTTSSTDPAGGSVSGVSPWRSVPGAGLDISENSPDAVWMLEDFFVVYGENLGSSDGPLAARIDPMSGEATPIAPPPMGWRTAATVVWTGREVLVVGGASDSTGTSHLGAAYDPVGDSWRQLTGPPELSGGRVLPAYLTGVWNGSELVFWTAGWALDPATDEWRRFPEPPLAYRGGYATVAIGEDILVWGGCEPVVDCDRDPDTWLADGALYVAATGEWEPLPDSPLAPAPYVRAVSDGRSATLVSLPVEGRAEGAVAARFTPGVGWTELPDPPDAPLYGTALAQAGDAVVLGGPADGGDQWVVLRPGADHWETIPTPATTRRFHAVADGAGHLLVAGGSGGGPPELLSIASAWERDVPTSLDIPVEVEVRNGEPFLVFTEPDDLPPGTAYLAVRLDGRDWSRSSAGAGLVGSTHGTRLDPGSTVTVELVAEDVDMLPLATTEPVTLDVP